MAKKLISNACMTSLKRKVKNVLPEGKGEELKALLVDLFEELENSEEVLTVEDLESKVKFMLETIAVKNEEVADKVVDVVMNKVKSELNKVMPADKAKMPIEVQNKVARTILFAKQGIDLNTQINDVLVKNGVTGFTFGDFTDFAINTKWQDNNPLFAKLNKVQFSKFFYSTDEMTSATILAKGWQKGSTFDKKIQEINITPKQIQTQYIYKRQQLAFEDLDSIEQEGQLSQFLNWLLREIDVQIINSILIQVLIGDTLNVAGDQITSFETIGGKTTSDVFTTVVAPTTTGQVSLEDVKKTVDAVINPTSKEKVLVISNSLLSALSGYVYAAGGTTQYRSKEELAMQLGVSEIYVSDILNASSDVHAVCLLPQEYWWLEKKTRSFDWVTPEKNLQNYMRERNVGGAIKGLLSTSVLKG